MPLRMPIANRQSRHTHSINENLYADLIAVVLVYICNYSSVLKNELYE